MSSLGINNKININKEQLSKLSTSFESVNFGASKKDVLDISTKNTKNIDKSNDGKFSLGQGLKNLVKGMVSPITAMFSSPKAFLSCVGMVAGSVALLAATGGVAAPLFVAAGVVMGTFQLAKAGIKIAKAKNGDDIEKALFDVGAGTSTIGLSVVGAKASLKQAGMVSEGNILSSVGKCFTGLKVSVKGSYASFKTGTYKTNFINLFKGKKTSQIKDLDEYSQILNKEATTKVAGAKKQIQDIFPNEFKKSISARPKGSSSIYDKLLKIYKKGENIKDIAYASKQIGDLVGIRLILEKATIKNMDKVAISIAKAIDEGKLIITRIENYMGPNGKPYLLDHNIKLIENTARLKGIKIEIASGESAIKAGGYTTAQMDVIHSNGVKGEFQIRGTQVNNFAEVEHIPYDLRQGKCIDKGNPILKTVYEPVKDLAVALKDNKVGLEAYNKYLKGLYEYSRDLELELSPSKPIFPTELNKLLSLEQLNKIHSQAKLITHNYSRTKFSEVLAIAPVHSGSVNFFKEI